MSEAWKGSGGPRSTPEPPEALSGGVLSVPDPLQDQPDHDYGAEAQQAAEEHLRRCYEALDDETEGSEVDWDAIGVQAPFCGCDTCVVREVLTAVWPVFKARLSPPPQTSVRILL